MEELPGKRKYMGTAKTPHEGPATSEEVLLRTESTHSEGASAKILF